MNPEVQRPVNKETEIIHIARSKKFKYILVV